MSEDLRKLLLETGLTFGIVCLIALGFDAYVERTPEMQLPNLMRSSILTGKYLKLDKAFRDGAEIDVMLLGLSPMMMVNAADLGSRLEKGSGHPVRAFNLAGPNQRPSWSLALMRQIVVPRHRPALIVQGLMPLDLLTELTGRPDVPFSADDLDFSVRADGPVARIHAWTITHIALLQYRNVIRDWITRTPAAPDIWNPAARGFDTHGDYEFRAGAPVEGFNRVETEYRSQLAKFGRMLNHEWAFESTRELARWCTANDIELVLANTPVHPLFLELLPAGGRSYRRFNKRVRVLAKELDLALFQPAGNGPANPELFVDTHHHNVLGAQWLTNELASFLLENGLAPQSGDASRP